MTKKSDVIDVSASVVEVQGKRLFDRVSDFLTAKDWNFSAFEDKQYFSLHLRLRDGMVRVVFDTMENAGWSRLLVYATYPTYVPESKRLIVADAISRINYTQVLGSLDIDMEDGEVRSKVVLESDTYLGEEMIDRVLRRSLDLAEQYQAPLLAIAFGSALPGNVLGMVSRSEDATLQ